MEISDEGEVKIYFSEPLNIPGNYTNMDNNTLDIILIPGIAIEKKYKKFTFNVTHFTENYFVITLKFEYPVYISA